MMKPAKRLSVYPAEIFPQPKHLPSRFTRETTQRDSLAMFEDGEVEVRDTKRIVKRAEYDRIAAQKPQFGMTTQELYVLHRERNHKAVLERREYLKEARVRNDGRGLIGQTFAHPVDAECVGDGIIDLPLELIRLWKDKCHYFCIAINETHESFWWDIETLYEGINIGEQIVGVWLLSADEYHRPIKIPLGWPWGKSPLEKLGINYMDFPGRIYLTDSMAARPGFDGYGNLHPSGGESEGYYVK